MIGDDLNQTSDYIERGLIAADIVIAAGQVRKDIKLRGIFGKSLLPVSYRASDTPGAIQRQAQIRASPCGFPLRHYRHRCHLRPY